MDCSVAMTLSKPPLYSAPRRLPAQCSVRGAGPKGLWSVVLFISSSKGGESLSRPGGWWLHRHSLHNPSLNCEFYTFCLQEVEPKTNKLPSMQAGEQGLGPLRWPRGSGRPSEAGLSAPITCSPTFPFLRPAQPRLPPGVGG